MEVTNKDLEKVIDLYFKEQYAIYKNRYKSFHQFIDEIIYKELKNNSNIIHENFTKDKIYRYKFVFDDISLRPPLIENEDRFMWPEDARMKHLTYASKLIATVKQVQETIDINTGEKSVRVVGDIEREVPIAKIPIMVRSKFCTLNIKKDEKNTECKYDPGGYFIVNGSEKVVLSLERICENKQLVFTKKDNTYDDGLMYYVDIHSKGREINGYPQKLTIKMKKDNSIVAVISQLAEVPIFILFRALGLVSDSDITRYISYDISDTEMINLVRFSMDSAVPDPSKPESDANKKIKTQKEALDFLITKIRQSKRYSDTSLEVQYEQKRKHLNRILTKNLLPHMGDNHTNKAFYIGLAVNKLLATFLGRREVDARDSYGNKRVDEVGVLLGQLFKQHYNKMLNDCSRHFRRKNNDDVNPINVINQIKPNTIEQGLKSGLMTGIWGASRSKKGVSQALQRLTYLQTISYFRRVITPSVDPSTNKQTSIRHVRNIQFGFICGVETPEGQSIGLVKNLSMMCNITLMLTSQIYIIKNILRGKLISLTDVPPEMYQKMVKVFLNGEWLGLSEEPVRLVEFLKNKKRNGDIESTVSIILNIANKEINIYCDGGRMYRPLLKVKDNKLVITKKIIDEIGDGPDQINKWSQLLLKYPDIIEYVDVEESETLMIAMYADDVRKQWKMMNTVIKSPNKQGNPINRYNSVYTRLTHCEFHPSMQLGMVSSNIPFCEHNQSPRNIYNFSQARQAMGLYATNHRLRMDISYLLYHPQVPLVITKAMRYLNTIELPAGENAIVAIASYSGYNQEDSVIMSQSAIDRGLFNSTSLKKYHELIQKNPSTSQDDIFVKPDRNKVSGMKDGNYDKLNDRGFVPEETQVVKGDVIIGKVSPILPTATSSKIYRDSSKMYKGNVPGVVDKVHTGIYNSEGYEMYNMRIRSQRIPKIGDKFSSRHGQKGTIGITLPNTDMPFTKDGIQPDIIVNPNAIPSRMTIGQLLECLTGKVGAILGHLTDGTPFNNVDIEEVKDILEGLGYNREGYETLTCGMTGKRMKAEIFIGPTFYYRLKHLVDDKIHSRAMGPRQILTRQPPEGRSRDGGLRFGEMERDVMCSYGMAQFLKERLVDTSDIYHVWVCDTCGLFASKMINKNIYVCNACRNYTNTTKISIPYAFKLLLQELQAISIAARIKVKKDEFVDSV